MNGGVLLAAALLLLGLPGVALRLRIQLRPSDWARTTMWSTGGSLLLIETAAIMCSAPTVLRLLGRVGPPHFFPGGEVAGWISLAVAVAIPGRAAIVFADARRVRNVLRVDDFVGSHRSIDGVDIVVIDAPQPVALAVPGRLPQILVSSSAVDRLRPDELELVLRHERSHLEHHHTAYLFIAAAFGPVTRNIPVMGEPLRRLSTWLERWADDDSAPTLSERRSIHASLGQFGLTTLGSAAASISSAELAVERIQALLSPPAASKPISMLLILASGSVLAALGSAPILARLL